MAHRYRSHRYTTCTFKGLYPWHWHMHEPLLLSLHCYNLESEKISVYWYAIIFHLKSIKPHVAKIKLPFNVSVWVLTDTSIQGSNYICFRSASVHTFTQIKIVGKNKCILIDKMPYFYLLLILCNKYSTYIYAFVYSLFFFFSTYHCL